VDTKLQDEDDIFGGTTPCPWWDGVTGKTGLRVRDSSNEKARRLKVAGEVYQRGEAAGISEIHQADFFTRREGSAVRFKREELGHYSLRGEKE